MFEEMIVKNNPVDPGDINKECPICLIDIVSDAAAETSCKLCGMNMDKEGLSLKSEKEIFYFCCNQCKKSYKNYQ